MEKELIILKKFAKEIKEVYSAIENKIEELVVLLNESSEEDKSSVKGRVKLSEHLSGFLGALREKIGKEKGFIEKTDWTGEKKVRFLGLIKEVDTKIKELSASIQLTKKSNNTKIIKAIDKLYKQIEVELEEEEEMLEAA